MCCVQCYIKTFRISVVFGLVLLCFVVVYNYESCGGSFSRGKLSDTSASNLSDFIVFRLFEEPFDHDEQRILSDRHAFPKSTAECCPAKHMRHIQFSPFDGSWKVARDFRWLRALLRVARIVPCTFAKESGRCVHFCASGVHFSRQKCTYRALLRKCLELDHLSSS